MNSSIHLLLITQLSLLDNSNISSEMMTRENILKEKTCSDFSDSLTCQGEKGAAAGGYPTWVSMAIQLHQGQSK